MIRMFLLAAGFMAITISLLVMQPGSNRQPATDEFAAPVTRAEPALDLAVEPDINAPAPQAPAVAVAPSAPRAADDQSMRHLTWNTLSNLNQATGRETAPGQPGSLLHTIVRRSLNEQPGAATAQRATGVYVVQQGDTLVGIAERVYGDVNMTGPLFAANQELLMRPDKLQAGQTLVLPGQ